MRGTIRLSKTHGLPKLMKARAYNTFYFDFWKLVVNYSRLYNVNSKHLAPVGGFITNSILDECCWW